jgi:restriction system protein
MSHLRSVDAYVFQNMVAALLRGVGYFVPFIAPKGKDGGVDVIAYSDPLGAKQPILKVQVKHFAPDNPVPVDVINALLGVTLGDGSVPVVVTSGRFTEAAKAKARTSNVRLIDGDEFVSLWIDFFNKMDESDRALMPIVPFWFIKRD